MSLYRSIVHCCDYVRMFCWMSAVKNAHSVKMKKIGAAFELHAGVSSIHLKASSALVVNNRTMW